MNGLDKFPSSYSRIAQEVLAIAISQPHRPKKAFVVELVMNKITLIGEKQARVGFRFLFEEATGICSECSVKRVCLGNLESGRLYEISKVTRKKFPCLLHSEDAVVVEVSEPAIEGAVPARIAMKDALITYTKIDCKNASCGNWDKCFPTGLAGGVRYRVLDVKGPLRCPLGAQLLLVSLQR